MGVQSLFKFAGSIRTQSQTFGGFADIGAVKGCRFKKYGFDIVSNLTVFPSHNARYADFFLRIANHENISVQLPHLLVQCLELIPVLGTSDNNLMTCNGIQVKSMHWLAVLLHHIIGNVHQIVDGTDTAGAQPPLHPFRRRRDFDIGADPCTVSAAQIRVFYFYRNIIIDILSVFFYFHHRSDKGLAEGCRCLSCNSQYTVAIHSVRGDFIFKYGISHAKGFNSVGAWLHILLKNVNAVFRGFRVHISV